MLHLPHTLYNVHPTFRTFVIGKSNEVLCVYGGQIVLKNTVAYLRLTHRIKFARIIFARIKFALINRATELRTPFKKDRRFSVRVQ